MNTEENNKLETGIDFLDKADSFKGLPKGISFGFLYELMGDGDLFLYNIVNNFQTRYITSNVPEELLRERIYSASAREQKDEVEHDKLHIYSAGNSISESHIEKALDEMEQGDLLVIDGYGEFIETLNRKQAIEKTIECLNRVKEQNGLAFLTFTDTDNLSDKQKTVLGLFPGLVQIDEQEFGRDMQTIVNFRRVRGFDAAGRKELRNVDTNIEVFFVNSKISAETSRTTK